MNNNTLDASIRDNINNSYDNEKMVGGYVDPEGFIENGGLWRVRALAAEKRPLWVKASERLPLKDGYYHVRKEVKKSTEQEKDVQYYYEETKSFSWNNVIEWLDEGE